MRCLNHLRTLEPEQGIIFISVCVGGGPADGEAFKRLEQYGANHAEMPDYPRYRACGFDIGSGPTESLCRMLTARLKGGGKRRNRPNAEALMALAALKQSRLWEGHWAAPARKAG